MIYLDAAALVKLIRAESGTREFIGWLNERQDSPLVCSALAEVEVARALRWSAPPALVGVPGVLNGIYRLEIDANVRAIAASFEDPLLRTLDAIHLATAQMLARSPGADFQAFVTYDRRLLDAAKVAGLPVASPGQDD